MGPLRVLILFVALASSLLAACQAASQSSSSPTSPGKVDTAQLKQLTNEIGQAVDDLKAGNVDRARQDYKEFDEGWDKVEDNVKARSSAAYKQIEDAMDDVKSTLVRPDKPEAGSAESALSKLGKVIDDALPSLR